MCWWQVRHGKVVPLRSKKGEVEESMSLDRAAYPCPFQPR